MRIDILVLDGVFDLGLSAVLDVFQTANELIEMSDLAVTRFEPRIVGLRKVVKTSQGLSVPVRPVGTRAADTVVVPAIGFKMPGPLEAALRRPDVQDTGDVLRRWARQGATVTAACIGTFVLAESGLLDAQQATTTWWLAPLFRRRYPNVMLDESNMLVKSGRFVTAGAALGHMDLALWLVRTVSPQLATLTAKYLIVDSRPSQSAYALVDHLVHDDPIVQRFESWARARLTRGFRSTMRPGPSARASERSRATCRTSSASRRSRISRVCVWSARCIFSRRAMRVSSRSRRELATRMARRCGRSCGAS
jgi:transcriptional regulator GlxA family with amidase domain